MWTRALIYWMAGIFLSQGLTAQQVLYSPYLRSYSFPQFQVVGKAGSYYWVKRDRPSPRQSTERSFARPSFFEVYDGRLSSMFTVPAEVPSPGTIKEYLVPGKSTFDQLQIVSAAGQTQILLHRHSADGMKTQPLRIVANFPFREDPDAFLLLRSASEDRIALLAFETQNERPPRLHIILFNADWTVLQQHVIHDAAITQPCIQDDAICFPIESFDDLPIKLADNGEWIMCSSSRTGNGFTFFHVCEDGSYSVRHLGVPPAFSIDEVTATIDNEGGGASAAVLSAYGNSSVRQLHAVHYSMQEGRFDFDSSYAFNTLAGELHNRNMVMTSLVAMAGHGYLYCKEYGRQREDASDDIDMGDAAMFAAGTEALLHPLRTEGFVRSTGLGSLQSDFSRGDLSLFYFPLGKIDSTWSGLIHVPQTTEMNWPSLSYLVLPSAQKLLLAYNAQTGFSSFANSTALDHHGNPTDGSLLFWKFNRPLNFQQARRIAPEEVAIPYLDKLGFAIVHLP